MKHGSKSQALRDVPANEIQTMIVGRDNQPLKA
jgi:hypothetical protein